MYSLSILLSLSVGIYTDRSVSMGGKQLLTPYSVTLINAHAVT